MSISSENRKAGPYLGNGVATVFSFTFKVFTTADVLVTKVVNLTGIETVLVLTTDYTVSLNADQNVSPGGSITLVAGAMAATHSLTITSQVANKQPVVLTNAGGFFPTVINDALDRLTILVQQVRERITRSISYPVTDASNIATTLPSASVRALKVLSFDVNGAPIATVAATDVENAAGNAAVAVAAAAAAVTSQNAASTSATLAAAWAAQLTTAVAGGEFSAKENAVGTSVTTGSAKDWASKISAAVVSGEFSAKAWARDNNVSLLRGVSGGGSAKDWANYIGGPADSSEYSAKAYASGLGAGSIATGSAKEWASKTGSTVDGSEYSAKYWAQQSAIIAAMATGLANYATDAAFVAANGAAQIGDLYLNTTSSMMRFYGANGWNNIDARINTYANDAAFVTENGTATAGDMYYNSTTLKIRYYSTAWNDVGSGAGGSTNFINNGSAETDTSGWATYLDAAGVSPVDGTGGSPVSTFIRQTSSPMIGLASFEFIKGAANRQGEGFSYDFTIDAAYKAKVLQLSFEFMVTSGTFVPGSDSTNSDMMFHLYDITNAILIPLSSAKLFSNSTTLSSTFLANFQSASNSTAYRLIGHVASTSAVAYTLKFDNFSVGPSNYVYGTPITDWQAYTPTSSWVTNTTHVGKWRRVGSNIEIMTKASLTGAPNNVPYNVSLPAGLAIDPSKFAATPAQYYTTLDGTATGQIAGGGYPLYLTYDTTTSIGVVSPGTAGAYGVGAQLSTSIPNTWGSGHDLTVFASVPILGWASTTQMSTQNSAQVVACSYQFASTQSIPNTVETTVIWNSLIYDKTAIMNTSTGVITVTEPGIYQFASQTAFLGNVTGVRYAVYAKNGTKVHTALDVRAGYADYSTSMCVGEIELAAGNTFEIKVYQSSGGALNIEGTRSYLMFSKKQATGSIAATETIAVSYGLTVAQAVATGGVLKYDTKVLDTHGAYDTTTGLFTAPAPGVYEIAAANSMSASGGSYFKHQGVAVAYAGTSGAGNFIHGSHVVRMKMGETLGVYCDNAGTYTATSVNGFINRMSIKRIGI